MHCTFERMGSLQVVLMNIKANARERKDSFEAVPSRFQHSKAFNAWLREKFPYRLQITREIQNYVGAKEAECSSRELNYFAILFPVFFDLSLPLVITFVHSTKRLQIGSKFKRISCKLLSSASETLRDEINKTISHLSEPITVLNV